MKSLKQENFDVKVMLNGEIKTGEARFETADAQRIMTEMQTADQGSAV
jgi:hypothetical protein